MLDCGRAAAGDAARAIRRGSSRRREPPIRSCSACRRAIRACRPCSRRRAIPTARFDERDLELLSAAAQLGGLVLEGARPRAAAGPARWPRAAPLIGSTSVMQALRDARRARRRHRLHGADRRRERHGQGARRAADPRAEPAAARAVRGRQLRRRRRDAARGGAVRHRGAHGDRRARPARQVRARRRRHAVSRRGVGPVAVGAGQAAARDPGPGGRARRRHRHAAASTRGSSRRPTGRCRSWSSEGCSAPTCTTG